MEHALIIGENRQAVDVLEENLWIAGYRSILAVDDTPQAWAILRSLRPNLIVVLPEILRENLADDLYEISEVAGAPIIVATADPDAALHCLGPGVSLEGPYAVDEMAEARTVATHAPLALAHAA